MKSLGPQVGFEPRKAVRELVQNTIVLEPAMAATAMALFLIRTGDPVTIAALAEELTLEYLARLIRAERAAAESQPDDDGVAHRQPFLPEFAEQLKQLPAVIPNRAGDQIPTLKAKYPDLQNRLKLLNHQYWANRSKDPEIAATRALLRAMQPHYKENRDIVLEQALILESQKKLADPDQR